MKRHLRVLLALVAALALVTAACGSDGDSGDDASSDTTAAAGGGTQSLTLGAPADCETNPFCIPGLQRVYDVDLSEDFTALDAGITLLDTADIYAPSWDTMGHNEKLVGEALRSWDGDASRVVVATKGGITRSAEGGGRDGSPAYLRRGGVGFLEFAEGRVPDGERAPCKGGADRVLVRADDRQRLLQHRNPFSD